MPPTSERPNHMAAMLQVVALGGYGTWLWLGVSLLLGPNQLQRDGVTMALLLGGVLVATELLPAGHRGRRSAAIAWATWLPPLLAVATLAFGDIHGATTRGVGAALMVGSFAALWIITHADRERLPTTLRRATTLLPTCRLANAAYLGGLWLWLCLRTRGVIDSYAWPLLLLVLALGLGLLDSGLWQALQERESDTARNMEKLPARLAAALLAYALPCIALLQGDANGSLLAAALAAPACVAGRLLDRYLYECALEQAGSC